MGKRRSMKSGAVGPTCRKMISACALASGTQIRSICPSDGSMARPRVSQELPPSRSQSLRKAKASSGNSPIRRGLRFTSGLWFVPLSAGQHPAHEIVLREDFKVVLKRFVGLVILLQLDQAHDLHLPRSRAEGVQID